MDNTNVNVNAEDKKENAKVEGLKIELEQPANFNPIADVMITTTTELCKTINSIFSQVFRDFYGTALEVKFQPQISAYIVVPQLTFRVLPDDEYKKPGNYAFKTLTAQSENDSKINLIRRVALANSASGAKITITDDGKSAISDFLLPNIDANKYDWNSGYDVIPLQSDTYIRVFKLDISKIMKKIYGDEIAGSKNKERYYYQITPTFKLNANMQYKQNDIWSLNVLRLNQKNLNKGLTDLGYGIPTDAGVLSNVVAVNS